MTSPALSIRNSGFYGRGYQLPTRPNPDDLDAKGNPRATKYPGITTVIGALDKGGVSQWVADLTASYAVANAADLAERDEDWGFKRLRFFHSRKPDYDNPETNLNNFHAGVLDDLANQGTIIHQAVEAFIKDDPFGFPEWTRPEQAEAFEEFLTWADENVEEFVASETTVFNPEAGYAGTGDVWARLKNKPGLWYLDVKSARKVHDSHLMQGAAIQRAEVQIVEDEAGVEFKGRKWAEKPADKVERVGVLQVRQRSVDDYGQEVPAFCKLTEFSQDELDAAYEQFLGALRVRKGQAKLRDIRNAVAKKEKEDAVEYF